MRSLPAVVATALFTLCTMSISVFCDEPSGFATDAPTTPPAGAPPPSGPTTPKPTADNAPPLDPADYAPYMRHGTGSLYGKVSVHLGTANDSIPPEGLPVYLIPATAYTQWYLGLHVLELRDMGPRTPVIHHGGYQGLIERNAYKRYGYAGPPDYTKPVPFTSMDPRAFHAVRTTRAGAGGAYAFTGLPAGSYLLLSHWPIKLSSTTYNTSGQEGFFGGYNATTTSETDAHYVLFYFGISTPQKVTAGKATRIFPDNYNAVLGGAPCGPHGCGRLVIDQWLTLDERSAQ